MYLQVTEMDQAQGDLTIEMLHGLLSEAVARGCPQTTAVPGHQVPFPAPVGDDRSHSWNEIDTTGEASHCAC